MSSQFLTDEDLLRFNAGRNFHLYEKLGAHPVENGVHFAVWAPNARRVTAIGEFNDWDNESHPLEPLGSSGVWAGIVHEAKVGQIYKYHVASDHNGYEVDNADPVGFCTETPPHTGSVIWDIDYEWHDQKWMEERRKNQALNRPMSIYEVHLGSWMRTPDDHNRPLSYTELANRLTEYVTRAGFTHVEFMPVMEYPFGGSWGYQVTGFFAPTRRYGDPQALMYLIDRLHQAGIGVILDWVPSHFPADEHGLAYFDGTHLYEHADPRQGHHPDWNSNIFNYGRNEIRSFLISSALFWLDKYHADGLRVDAVASMLYLDYSRKDGEWIPNRYGGRENLEALEFVRDLNKAAYEAFPGIQMIAEESTTWPMVSRPVYLGGLGFGLKWDMGWMHDTLRYFALDPIHRRYHHNDITFRSLYAFHENFVLSLSHDECVHGKGAMIAKMAGDDRQKFANLRCLYTYMYSQPGKKLLFMGDEIAQWSEWNHDSSIDWDLLEYDRHRQIQKLVTDLNHLYRNERALHLDCDPQGFEWIDGSDQENSVLSYLRRTSPGDEIILCVFNFTPVPRKHYRVGVPNGGSWEEIFNCDASTYGGSGKVHIGTAEAQAIPVHNRPFALTLSLPPLAGIFLRWKQNT